MTNLMVRLNFIQSSVFEITFSLVLIVDHALVDRFDFTANATLATSFKQLVSKDYIPFGIFKLNSNDIDLISLNIANICQQIERCTKTQCPCKLATRFLITDYW